MLKCKHCNHEWDYQGKSKYQMSCPKCHQYTRIKYKEGYTVPKIDEVDLAYIAGFFDGEGSIYISSEKGRNNKRFLRMSISIGNTDGKAIDFVSNRFGKGVVSPNSKIKSGKKFYIWRVSGYTASEILKTMLPYMKIKRNKQNLLSNFNH